MNTTGIWLTDAGTLLIPLNKEVFGLFDDKVESCSRTFEPKEEVHITVVGKALGQEIGEAVKRDPAIESQIRQVIEETGWSYEKRDEMYHVSKDKISLMCRGICRSYTRRA